MATETRPTRKRKANPLKLQRESSQKFRVPHEKDTRSPIGAKKKGGKGSARGRGSSVSTGENASPFERRDTVSRIVAEDPFGIRKNYGNVSSRPLQGSDATSKWSDSQAQLKDEYTAEPESDYEAEVRGAEKAIEDIKAMEEREARELISAWDESKTKWDESTDGESDYEAEVRGAEKTMEDIKAMEEREAIERMKNWAASTTKWEKKADLYDLPLMSPFTLPGKATQELKVDFDGPPRTSPSTSPSEARDKLDARVARIRQRSRILQMQGNVEENHQKQPHPKERDSNHDSQLQSPDSGDALCDDDRVTIEDSGSRSPSNTKESDQDPLPQFPETDHNIDETSNRKNDAVSDLGHESDESGTSSPSPRSSNNKERDILDSQFQPSGPERTLVDASPTNDAVEGQTDPETNRLRVSPETTHSSSILVKTNLVSQPKSPSSDQIKSPDSQPQYPGGGGVTVGKDSAQDEVEEHFDAEAWLNSDSPLPGNYRAIFGDEFQGPEPTNPNLSNDSSSGTDSLVVSPTRSDEEEFFEGRTPCAALASSNAMKIFDEYAAKFPLKPFSEEKEAEDERMAKAATDNQNEILRGRDLECSSMSSAHTSSEDSLLLSPDEDDDGRPIDSKALQDDSDKEKEEEASQAALIIYELYGAKHEMKTELEEKEAKFKREIRRAWEQPRPPPTTREQKADRLALAKLESKDIFDEFGEQQRPVHTDPRMVLLETTVNTMITRARLNYALGDYPQMYTQANHAAAAAGPLKFPPLTARCFYYRGMASYHYRAFSMAKDDFLDSRGCAGLYGISSESINYYTEKIDQAHDPETVIIEPFRPRGNSGVGKNERTTSTRSTNVDSENEPSPSALGSAATLVGSSPTSPGDMALPMSPFSSPNKKERSAAQSREEASSQSQPPREPDILGGFPVDGEPQPKFDDVPNYQPQEQAISEEIRKDIFESKAQSLNPASEVISKEANSEETRALSPPSMASTEWTLLGSATSQGTARRVPRPHVPPITTAFAKLLIRQASLDAVLHSNSTDEMDEDERMAVFGEARENATPVSGSTDEMDEDEIMREFGAAKSGYIGAQGDDFTPVEDQTRGWGRH